MTKTRLIVAAILLATPAYAAPGGSKPGPELHIRVCNADSFYRDMFIDLGIARNVIAHLHCGFYSGPS